MICCDHHRRNRGSDFHILATGLGPAAVPPGISDDEATDLSGGAAPDRQASHPRLARHPAYEPIDDPTGEALPKTRPGRTGRCGGQSQLGRHGSRVGLVEPEQRAQVQGQLDGRPREVEVRALEHAQLDEG